MAIISKIDMDNGSFPLAKDAIRVLAKTKLSGAHRAIIDVIWLETYGWYDENNQHDAKIKKRKTSARIVYQTFIDETCMGKTNISSRVNELIIWGVIIRDKNTNPYTYSFNVNVDQWDPKIFRGASVARPDDTELCEQITVMRTDNSYEDDEQGVMRMHNSYAVEPTEISALDPLLNNTLNNLLNNTLNNKVIFDHWNEQKIIVHRELIPDMVKAIEKAVKDTSLEVVQTCITHFGIMLHDESYKLCDYDWGLITFLQRRRGYREFADDGEKWINYQKYIRSRASPSRPRDQTTNIDKVIEEMINSE